MPASKFRYFQQPVESRRPAVAFPLAATVVVLFISIVTGCEQSAPQGDTAQKQAASAATPPPPPPPITASPLVSPPSAPSAPPAPPSPTPKSATAPTPPTSQSREAKITTAITLAIAKPAPAGYAAIPAGTKLLGVEIIASKIRLNFNKALLLNGTGRKLEDAVKQLTNPISDIVADMANVEYQLLIEGKPLAEFL